MSDPQHIPDPGRVLAPYAAHPRASRGRYFNEPDSPPRSCFQRDRDRIIHSTAFRRLKHKTQVFVYHEGDHYRTRLTHSIEVSQIARSLARALQLNEDLAEALALAHDLGHPPFGHAGEAALQDALEGLGGFDHNEQTFRVVTRLERRYAEFDGLNLTWECLEGLAKHNGPLATDTVPESVAQFDREFSLDLQSYPSLEAQVAALADDIAYNNHDLDDGLRANLFALADLKEVALVGPIIAEVSRHYPGLEEPRVIHETVRRVITRMVEDLVAETRRRIAAGKVSSVEEVRRRDRPLASFSEEMREVDRELKDFLFIHMYRHQKVRHKIEEAQEAVRALFRHFMASPGDLPEGWRKESDDVDSREPARLVADYIAGMPDRFALIEWERLCRK
jgi:dGTPase